MTIKKEVVADDNKIITSFDLETAKVHFCKKGKRRR